MYLRNIFSRYNNNSQMQQSTKSSREFVYSVVDLIELVKARPIIWDSMRPDFRTFGEKDRAWKEIYRELDDEYRTWDKRKQTEVGMRITAKWRNVRDAFIRSFRKRIQHSNVKKYMYHDRLTFMLKLLNSDGTPRVPPQRRQSCTSESMTESHTEASTSLEVDEPYLPYVKIEPEEPSDYNDPVTAMLKVEIEDDSQNQQQSEQASLETCSRKRQIADVELEEQNEDHITSKSQRLDDNPVKQEEEPEVCVSNIRKPKEVTNIQASSSPDEDESFFASILSSVRDMDEDERLDFRMGVLKLIHETRRLRRIASAANNSRVVDYQ